MTVSSLLAMDKGGERPEVAKTPQARSVREVISSRHRRLFEVQPAQSPATAYVAPLTNRILRVRPTTV